MIKTVLRFALLLTVILSLAFGVQAFIQDQMGIGSFEKHLPRNYVFNLIAALLFFAVLNYFKKKKSNQLGFIFMFASMTKFGLFLVLIYPTIDHGLGVKNAEFATFFIPYSICSVIEIVYLTGLLKSEN